MSDRLQEKDIVRGVEIQKQERLGSPLCSRNARPMKTLVGRAQLGAPQAPLLMGGDGREMERSGRTPTLLPCSRNAHPPKGLVRRPQLEQHGCSAVMNLKSYKKEGERERKAAISPLPHFTTASAAHWPYSICSYPHPLQASQDTDNPPRRVISCHEKGILRRY